MNDKYCVYIHRNKVNGKQYCGITRQKPEYRWRDGHGYLHNAHFQNAISKYGWDGFEHLIICDGISHDEANRIEQEYIAKFDLINPESGYNQTNGGDGTVGYCHTEETKQKMSQSRIGRVFTEETRQKISDKNSGNRNGMYGATPWNKGKTMPEETKAKISESRKGKNTGEKHPMYGRKHSEASIRKMSESHKGRVAWNKGVKTGVRPKNTRRIGMYTDDGFLIKEFPSVTDAVKELGSCTGNICACCKGRVKHALGYVWKYLDN